MQPGDGARHQVVVVRRVEEHQARGLAWRDRERVDREDRAAILRATGGNVCTQCGERRAARARRMWRVLRRAIGPRGRTHRCRRRYRAPARPPRCRGHPTARAAACRTAPAGHDRRWGAWQCLAALSARGHARRRRRSSFAAPARRAAAGSFNTEKQGEDDGGPRRSEYCASREAPSAFSVALRRPPPASPC